MLQPISPPFVVAPPAGARVRTRLRVSHTDAVVLTAVGRHLGALAGKDLAQRCAEGRLDAKARAVSRRERKRALTAQSSSRWAGAITRTSEDAFQLALRNLGAERRSLDARTNAIRRRLASPVGGGRKGSRGYATQAERFEKQRRLQVLEARLTEVTLRLEAGRTSICRGGGRLAHARHHLDAAGLTLPAWRERWEAERFFICADGEAGKPWGNGTIRFHPDEGWCELRLPGPLAHLANQPHSRYRLSCPVTFPHRGDTVAAQAISGAVRYDVVFDVEKGRWYLDASWRAPDRPVPTLDVLRRKPVLAVDVNHGHLACCVLDPAGNPMGRPWTVALDLDGLPTSTRDGRLRAAISGLLAAANAAGCAAVVIEDLDFAEARDAGREHTGRRPSRGARGRRFRRLVAGLPTARFRNRLVQMAANTGLWVVAVDPAHTSRWGAEHWLRPLQQISPAATGHHAAATVVGRRGLGHRARRRERCAPTPPVDGGGRAADSAGPRPTPARKRGNRKAAGQPHRRLKTRTGERTRPRNQVTQDRSGPPASTPAQADGR